VLCDIVYFFQNAPAGLGSITLNLIKTGIYNSTTTMLVGQKVHFQLQITITAGSNDLDVELVSRGDNYTVIAICNPMVTYVGMNIAYTARTLVPVTYTMDNVNVSNFIFFRLKSNFC
jgi:hypothetical protein